MLLNITTTHRPATDLSYLLHKHPDRVQTFELSFGQAQVFYPEASVERCTASLLLDIDPIGLVRGKGRGEGTLDEYVNDRPYVASSFLSVAIARVFASALKGRSDEREELARTAIPLRAEIPVLPARGGEELVRRLFEPLGYEVTLTAYPLDERFPDWGESPYYRLVLERRCCLSEMLTHLYVLVPVLDHAKHYFVGEEEVEKLLRMGAGWLKEHPEVESIVHRYLKHRHGLARSALARLFDEDQADADEAAAAHDAQEEDIERPLSLNEMRMNTVVAALKACHARRVLDLGCGEGKLLGRLLRERQFEEIIGLDVSHRALEVAAERLKLDRLAPHQRERLKLLHGSLMYRDERLHGYDAAAVVEVIEHLDASRLTSCERVIFEFARPVTVIVSTPNAEYNVLWASLPAGQWRHHDHRFEWTRTEFEGWGRRVAKAHGYEVRFLPIGPEDPQVGAPTQMAIFAS